jgi:hypothetical protein
MASAISSAGVGQAGGVTAGESIREPPGYRFRIPESRAVDFHEAVWTDELRISLIVFVDCGNEPGLELSKIGPGRFSNL